MRRTKRSGGVSLPRRLFGKHRERKNPRRSRLNVEQLEARRLLAANLGKSSLSIEAELGATENSRILYVPQEPVAASASKSDLAFAPLPNSETFRLHSKPDSNFTIYLDFDGHVTEGTTWNVGENIATIVSPAYDRDGTPGFFSQLEHDLIQAAWARVAEDFAPFDINVTTEDPGAESLRKDTTGLDTEWGVRVVMTVDNFADCGCGGFAYLGSFEDSTDEPNFVFNNSLNGVSETITHEVGHQLTLTHDGLTNPTTEYYSGHGSGTTGWGSIMGAPFSKRITQWDRGEYFNASNGEDDLQEITTQNGFGFRSDDFGDSTGVAGRLETVSANTFQAFGVIEGSQDVDYFEFEVGTGEVSFTIAPQDDRPNLDVWAGIYDSSGNILSQSGSFVQSNPSDDTAASFTNVPLTAGTYFLKIDGVGTHGQYNPGTDSVDDPLSPAPWEQSSPEGYSHYGSLGQYGISGTFTPISSDSFSIAPLAAVKREGNGGAGSATEFTFTVTRSGNTAVASSVDYQVTATRQRNPGDSVSHSVDTSDFVGGVLPAGTVSFAASEVSKIVTVEVVGDTSVEVDEEFAVVLDNASAGWVLADSTAYGMIEGDESRANVQTGVQFRWRQENFTPGSGDNWAIDNVNVSGTPFNDDFDPDIDNPLWTTISGGTANSNFGGTGNSLFFSGSTSRLARTQTIEAEAGETLSFDLIFGNNSNGGSATQSGENVVLEYSADDGDSWTRIRTYDQGFFTSWTSFAVPIPTDAVVDEVDQNETNAGTNNFPFTVFRTSNLNKSINVDWQVVGSGLQPAEAGDFVGGTLPAGTLAFAAGEASRIVNVPVAGDTDFENDETFQFILTASDGGPIGVDRNEATIRNDDSEFPDDFGDAPDVPYGTLLASGGPHHFVDTVNQLFLGSGVDTEADGLPNPDATGDGADEDGVTQVEPLVAGTTVELAVTSSPGGGQLDYFFDFDGLGGFGNNPNEVFSTTLSGGTQSVFVTIPAGAVSDTFARFRISTAGGLGPVGPAANGEVEDYAVTIFKTAPAMDFGDAPDPSYATLLASNGARHLIGGPKLGDVVDAEPDGLANATSTGDGVDDDGVIFREALVPGTVVDVSVTSSGGQLDYFFDFDGDGTFGNSPDEIFSASVASGTQNVLVSVPITAAIGVTRARFRLSVSGGLGPNGLAADGEVEDYQVMVVTPPPFSVDVEDFDGVSPPALPAGWQVSSLVGSNDWLSQSSNSDSSPNHMFVEDISSASDSALTSPIVAISEQTTQLHFRNSYDTEATYDGGVLEISINGGAFQDIIAAGGTFVDGGYTGPLSNEFGNPLGGRQSWNGNSNGYIDTVVDLPAAAIGQNVQFGWRMGTDTSVAGVGWRVDTITLSGVGFSYDFGDAPDPSFPTLSSNLGAAHAVGTSGVFLGSGVDSEPDGLQSADASGDGQDEDGIVVPSPLIAGSTHMINVTAAAAGLLNAWIDFNGDGDWFDPGEQIAKDLPVPGGPTDIPVTVPAGANVGNALARFRLSSQSALSNNGIAPDGEVEDYQVTISAASTASSVAGRHIFYNSSLFDGSGPGPGGPMDGPNDSAAIATDKQALIGGTGPASFINYTSYSRGINGIMVDIDNAPATISLADFMFRVGNDSNPDGTSSTWVNAPSPSSFNVFAGQGVGGSDRIVITFTDNDIEKQWLQVRVLATVNTGLVTPDVHYWGNRIGETGNDPSGAILVNSQDLLGVLMNPTLPGDPLESIDNVYDFNRDGFVNSLDLLAILSNPTLPGNPELSLINPPMASPMVIDSGGDGFLPVKAVDEFHVAGLESQKLKSDRSDGLSASLAREHYLF